MKLLRWMSYGVMTIGSTAILLGGCHSSTGLQNGADGGGGSTSTGQGGNAGGGSTGTGGAYDGPTFGIDVPPGTLGHTQCTDGIDNDGDGKIDAADPECVGALDNDESTFATGIPGDNVDACKQDCFFDGESGMGNDGCDWNLKCDPRSPGATAAKACPYDANFHNCSGTQSQECVTKCGAVTPNGCDCFGCCDIPGAPTPIYLAASCTAADFGNPAKCPPCTQSTACNNPCGHCEICIGKLTLPADCGYDGGTPVVVCGNGYSACGVNNACPANTYCVTGCCLPNDIVP